MLIGACVLRLLERPMTYGEWLLWICSLSLILWVFLISATVNWVAG